MQKGSPHIILMQQDDTISDAPTETEHLHAVIDEILAPFGKKSPRATTILGTLSGPIDITAPNQHASKADREATKASFFAILPARSRAPSWIDRVTCRVGVLGLHLNFSSHPSQSDLAVR